uniref:ABC transporter subunit n=1 Tax=Porphyridium purpureum TaxID=35688 RepID=W0RYL7_PORPP|nr:ABC transporter subunit [Porphyridium purpureum]BAO23794.1 ABC transporter subunit [Porphyridium purpureum]
MNKVMKNTLIAIKDLYAKTGDVDILKGVNLSINKGEIHAIMGPNGSGKSTLSKVIAGHPAYNITSGHIFLDNEDISDINPEDRSKAGIFLAFQYPVEIPGVTNIDFLRIAYNSKQEYLGLKSLDPLEFLEFISKKLDTIGMHSSFLSRNVNEGFSGGEKKRNEILQMAILEPMFSILDETDSGLDIDALKNVANNINLLKSPDSAILLITHYQRLLDYVKPDYIHIMSEGKIIKTGDYSLALELEKNGYDLLISN